MPISKAGNKAISWRPWWSVVPVTAVWLTITSVTDDTELVIALTGHCLSGGRQFTR